MNYTDNYQLRKPVKGVNVADINDENANMDTIDAILHASQVSLAPAYDEHTTSENPYNTGDIVMYEFLMYKCLEDGVYGIWDPTKWVRTTAGEEGGSGGGGNADYVELTQAEYDELTPQEKMNGKLYFITDGQGEGGPSYFFPVIYSIEEREVGVWIDGKPLYQKSISFDNTSSANLAIDVTSLSIDKLPEFRIWNKNAGYQVNSYYDTSIDYINTYYDETGYIHIRRSSGEFAGTGYVTLLYTKTTDTPGSGKYNALGVPTVHYSTDEQIVGTWIDGKTLYQKTCNVTTNTNCYNASWTSLPLDNPPANADYMVDAELHGQCPNTNRTYRFQFENGAVQIASLTSEYILANTKITFRYTKSQS